MPTWVAIDEDLPDHKKTFNLRKALKLKKKRDAVGLIGVLLIFTLRNAWRDGNLEQYGSFGIAEACEWDGDPEELVKALRECGGKKDGKKQPGFLDGWVVHNWVEKANKLIRDRLYRKQQKVARGEGKSLISRETRDLWNEFAVKHGLEELTSERLGTRYGISFMKLKGLLDLAVEQPFLLGLDSGGWKMDLPWLTKTSNQAKVQKMKFQRRNGRGAALAEDDWKERSKDLMKSRSKT